MLLSIPTPATRANDSARFPSGNLPISSAVIAFNSIGKISYKSGSSEDDSRKYRRSLYVTENVKAGDKVCPENVRAIRPGLGLMPKHLDKVMQKSFIKNKNQR